MTTDNSKNQEVKDQHDDSASAGEEHEPGLEENETGVAEQYSESLTADELKEKSRDDLIDQVLEQSELIRALKDQMAELDQHIEELNDSNLRKAAELDNLRKRVNRDRAQTYEASRAAAVEAFLPVNDDLIRTLKAIEETDGSTSLKESGIEDGVRLVAEKFEEVLRRYNVERIDQTGVPFDVDLHDAMLRQKPEDEEIDSDIVLEVLENGYRMGDRTIRHAKVIVSE